MADVGNVQAIVARSSAKPLIAVLLFRFGEAGGAKSFLREWISKAPAGLAPEIDGQPALHFMFSWNGMERLLGGRPGLDVAQGRKEFELFFTDPMQAPDSGIAQQLGLVGASAPAAWWEGKFASRDIDLAIHISVDDPPQKADLLAQLRQSAAQNGVQELKLDGWDNDGALSGCRPSDGRLHFGYRDGITSPDVDWSDTHSAGTVDCREFVVGYPNDDYPTSPQKPGPWQDFARDGSYVGLSWVYQDVAGFNKFLGASAPQVAGDVGADLAEEWVAAKLMGRWRHGSPLSKYPDAPPPAPELNNEFGYEDDPLGERTPLGAHIRLVNCRDQPMKFANRVRFPKGPPRMIRRGFSYGPHLDGTSDDEKDRGIIGVFFFARVNEQFYTILRWINQTDFSDAYKKIPNGLNAQDALVANRASPKANTEFYIPRSGKAALSLQLADFVRYKGVAVLFAPSIKALNTLIAD
jgi:deferrochelatase/peroxidase EfeB